MLAGCASEGSFEPVSFEHDFSAGEPRVRTFELPSGVPRIDVAIEITGIEDPLRCEVRSPARVKLVDPTGREVVEVEVTGEAFQTGGRMCTATNAERSFDARPGTWTVTFAGEGNVRAVAGVHAAG